MQQIFADPGATHGGKTQVLRVEGFLLGRADQHQQQLRHQDQALGRSAGQAASSCGTSTPLAP